MDKLEDLLSVLLSRSRLLQGKNKVLERTVGQLHCQYRRHSCWYLIKKIQPSMVVYIWDPNTQVGEAGGL